LKASNWGRERHQERAARVKAVLNAAALPVTPSDTQIVSVLVGNPERCNAASDLLLTEHGIYIQPINYPTVPRGLERLRITPSPYHDDVILDAPRRVDGWLRVGLKHERQPNTSATGDWRKTAITATEYKLTGWMIHPIRAVSRKRDPSTDAA
jgi:5-aminolevulinate synthase